MGFKTIDDFELEDKTILLRVDINSPVKDGHVALSERMREHAKTIRELSDRGGKVVILAHQGRPGGKDFTTLEQHAKLLSECVGKNVGQRPLLKLLGNKFRQFYAISL